MHRSYLSALVVMLAVIATALAVAGAKRNDIQRGAYIVDQVAMCEDCHTPALANGEPDISRRFAGVSAGSGTSADMRDQDILPPNLTPSGRLSTWSDRQLAEFLMTGERPSGRPVRPPMPRYRLDEADAIVVSAYLRALPPSE